MTDNNTVKINYCDAAGCLETELPVYADGVSPK